MESTVELLNCVKAQPDRRVVIDNTEMMTQVARAARGDALFTHLDIQFGGGHSTQPKADDIVWLSRNT